MTARLLFIIIAYLEVTNSQYYGQPPPISYQACNYYSPATTPPVPQPTYAPTFASLPISAYPPTSTITQPPIFTPPYPFSPSFSHTSPALPAYVPSMLPPLLTFSAVPMFPPPPTYSLATPTIPSTSTVASKPTSAPTPKLATVGSATKCNPSTATAYYLTTQHKTPKAAVMEEKVQEKITEKTLPYPCPFCTGFANVPKNPKVPPPPPCSSVLPGILDKIPTIALPDELKLKGLSEIATPSPLLSDLFKNKLSGKLRFDQDLLDGFLTGLGLGKCCD